MAPFLYANVLKLQLLIKICVYMSFNIYLYLGKVYFYTNRTREISPKKKDSHLSKGGQFSERFFSKRGQYYVAPSLIYISLSYY